MQIIQIGLGGVGRELVRQVLDRRVALEWRYGVRLEYLALVDSGGALATGAPLTDAEIAAAVAAKVAGQSLAGLPGGRAQIEWPALLPGEPCLIVDVTAADGQGPALAAAVAAGHRVVLANKRPLSGPWDEFRALTARGATRYEATVGAGLPVIGTLQTLLDSGDTIERIEASMSGTLDYLCTELEAGVTLAEAVRAAHALGYTEPDPRDDLSGADVARKALILARTCGLPWTMADIPSEPLYPTSLAGVSRAEFFSRLGELDAPMSARIAEARVTGAALRYVATITAEGAGVELRALPAAHPLAGLRGPDNLFSFTTTRYRERPLVVRGPGAGLAVTAAGVLGDIIAAARSV